MNIKDFKWTREPDNYKITDDRVEIITQPGTDLCLQSGKLII